MPLYTLSATRNYIPKNPCSRLHAAVWGFERLEPYDGKLSRTVLRGGKDSNANLLPDYAGVECHHRPEIRNKPVVVGGDEEQRHGIVLAKNYLAKAAGIKTGETLWQARNKVDGLVVLPPNYPIYLRYSRLAREIYSKYTAQVESFGLDECWLDVSGDDGVLIANEIRERIKLELGVTASVGVSYNKIFAKLGSDIKKPDATTIVSEDNYKKVAWPLPVEDLLYVGSATKRKLGKYCIETIGELARTPEEFLHGLLGKVGNVLYSFANGFDQSPVMRVDEQPPGFH